MDATTLRWILAITGIIVIAGVYLYAVYQNKLRKRAEVRTFTQQELDSGQIEDQELSKELSSIGNMLDQNDLKNDISKIKINPAMDVSSVAQERPKQPVHLPNIMYQIEENNLVAHVLKHSDDRVLTGQEISDAFQHTGLSIDEEGYVRVDEASDFTFTLANMTASGSFLELNDAQFFTYGMVCFFDCSRYEAPKGCYELMLKKVDELVRVLDLKVYNEDLQLLTLQHVTDTRKRLESL
jgi:FtsZ-interacting cell division protein ZipA